MRRLYLILGLSLALILVASYVAWALMRPVPTPEPGMPAPNLFARLFPFGLVPTPPSTPTTPDGEAPAGPDETPAPQLRKVAASPVAGGAAFIATTSAVMIRFVERETGHVYETPADRTTVVRISNTTIPRIEKILWANINQFIASYMEEDAPQNFYADLEPGVTEQSLNGTFMAAWNRGALNSAGTRLLTVTETASGSTVTESRHDGGGARTVFTSPIRSWTPIVTSQSNYLATAPSAGVSGYLYRVVNGTLEKIAGGLPGLLALPSASGRYIALSSGGENGFVLGILDTVENTVYTSPLPTLATKCAWVSENPVALICGIPSNPPSGTYPNDWLLGRTSFSDNIWYIEPVTGTTILVASSELLLEEAVDVFEPRVTGPYMTFVNKKDLSFWSLRFLQNATTTAAR